MCHKCWHSSIEGPQFWNAVFAAAAAAVAVAAVAVAAVAAVAVAAVAVAAVAVGAGNAPAVAVACYWCWSQQSWTFT